VLSATEDCALLALCSLVHCHPHPLHCSLPPAPHETDVRALRTQTVDSRGGAISARSGPIRSHSPGGLKRRGATRTPPSAGADQACIHMATRVG
jgi:hypothetical protein